MNSYLEYSVITNLTVSNQLCFAILCDLKCILFLLFGHRLQTENSFLSELPVLSVQ